MSKTVIRIATAFVLFLIGFAGCAIIEYSNQKTQQRQQSLDTALQETTTTTFVGDGYTAFGTMSGSVIVRYDSGQDMPINAANSIVLASDESYGAVQRFVLRSDGQFLAVVFLHGFKFLPLNAHEFWVPDEGLNDGYGLLEPGYSMFAEADHFVYSAKAHSMVFGYTILNDQGNLVRTQISEWHDGSPVQAIIFRPGHLLSLQLVESETGAVVKYRTTASETEETLYLP